uniref:Unannotated protein n=1 Tax=freshwater metagenome TaxID=449393 RepID=A0A6J7PW60_9ZZZZ
MGRGEHEVRLALVRAEVVARLVRVGERLGEMPVAHRVLPAVAHHVVLAHQPVVRVRKGRHVEEREVSLIEEVVRHLRGARLPLHRRQWTADERRVRVLGHLGERHDRLLQRHPDHAEVLGNPGRCLAARCARDRQPRVDGRDLDTHTVGSEPVAVIRALQRAIHDATGAQWRPAVRALVAHRGEAVSEPRYAPALAEQFDAEHAVGRLKLLHPRNRVPAAAKSRVLIVEPGLGRSTCGHATKVAMPQRPASGPDQPE